MSYDQFISLTARWLELGDNCWNPISFKCYGLISFIPLIGCFGSSLMHKSFVIGEVSDAYCYSSLLFLMVSILLIVIGVASLSVVLLSDLSFGNIISLIGSKTNILLFVKKYFYKLFKSVKSKRQVMISVINLFTIS